MASSAPRGKEPKTDRLELRVGSRQSMAIRQAAEAAGKTVTSFVIDAAYLDAQRVLADRRLFSLDAQRWQRFVEALDRPTKAKPRIQKLMQEKGVLD